MVNLFYYWNYVPTPTLNNAPSPRPIAQCLRFLQLQAAAAEHSEGGAAAATGGHTEAADSVHGDGRAPPEPTPSRRPPIAGTSSVSFRFGSIKTKGNVNRK